MKKSDEKNREAKTPHEEEKIDRRQTRPMEGVPFKVFPLEIDRNLFQEKKKDGKQEYARKLILKAFAKVDEYPEKYGKPFKTLMPERTMKWKNVYELREMSTKLGDHMADWVEQTLEWAQRISNGATWKDVCNKPDTSKWYRLIEWKNGYTKLVGGCRTVYQNIYDYTAPCFFHDILYFSDDVPEATVPLIVLYEE